MKKTEKQTIKTKKKKNKGEEFNMIQCQSDTKTTFFSHDQAAGVLEQQCLREFSHGCLCEEKVIPKDIHGLNAGQ